MKTKAADGEAARALLKGLERAPPKSVHTAPEEPGVVQLFLTNLKRNFTVPSDDANFDPPKFAGWAGRPQVWSLYGISSLFFLATGMVILSLANTWVPMVGGLGGDFCSSYIEGAAYLVVAATSLHGDVICMGRRSWWHVGDRILAQALIGGNVVQVVALTCVDAVLGATAFVAVSLPLMCYGSSYLARSFRPYTACHTLWHFTGALNRSVVAGVAWAFGEHAGLLAEDQARVCRALWVFLAGEALLCAAVWTHSWRLTQVPKFDPSPVPKAEAARGLLRPKGQRAPSPRAEPAPRA